MDSKAKKAVSSIQRQINELGQIDISNVSGWSNCSLQIVKIHFGEDSEQFIYLKGLIFGTFWHYDQDRLLTQISDNKNVLAGYLKSCQKFIESEGIFEPITEKSNFLGTIDNQTLWAIITVIVPLLFGLGYWAGSFQDKINKVDLLPSQHTISKTTDTTNKKSNFKTNQQGTDTLNKKR